MFDGMPLQCRIQLCLIEAAVSGFVQDKILVVRLEFRNNVGVPGISDQDATLGPVWRLYRFPHACMEMSDTIRRIRTAQIRRTTLHTAPREYHLIRPPWQRTGLTV